MTQVLDFVLVGTKGFEPLTPTVSGLLRCGNSFCFSYLWVGRVVVIGLATRGSFSWALGGVIAWGWVLVKGEMVGGNPRRWVRPARIIAAGG